MLKRGARVMLLGMSLLLVMSTWDGPSADDGSLERVGGTVRLMDAHPSIALVAEYVHAWVDPGSWRTRVECVFFLHNEGPAVRALVGFPEYAGGNPPLPFTSFRSFVNGQEVECLREEGGSGAVTYTATFWRTKEVSFQAGELKSISDFYEVISSPFRYVLGSGGSWAGPIGVCDVVLTLEGDPDRFTIHSSPEAHRTGNEFRWHYSDFEPGRGDWPTSLYWDWGWEDADTLTSQ